MRAHLLTSFNSTGHYILNSSHPAPHPKRPTDILIRVTAASYCHTDAVVAAGLVPPQPPLPHIGCHEFAGEVVALHPEHYTFANTVSIPSVGTLVAIPGRGNHVCGSCLECDADSSPLPDPRGFSVFCPAAGAGLGVDRPGGFAEYAVVDARQVAVIPDGMTAVEVAPLMCAGLTIFAALQKLALKQEQRVAIIGCGGGLGHLGMQFAAKMGLRVLGVDAKDEALEFARDLGLDERLVGIVDARAQEAGDLKSEMGKTDGRKFYEQMGVDAAIVLADSQSSFDYASELIRNGGKLMVLSFPPDGFRLNAFDLVIRRVSIEGSLIGSNRAMMDMFKFCLEHDVRARVKTYPFDKLNELVDDYHRGVTGKLVLEGPRQRQT
jgi:D-arabinose 1-dehydrogenase-like Zn-dependent alcohol dehydrogenase